VTLPSTIVCDGAADGVTSIRSIAMFVPLLAPLRLPAFTTLSV